MEKQTTFVNLVSTDGDVETLISRTLFDEKEQKIIKDGFNAVREVLRTIPSSVGYVRINGRTMQFHVTVSNDSLDKMCAEFNHVKSMMTNINVEVYINQRRWT